jgi:branched-chain amino acid transport system permease protein
MDLILNQFINGLQRGSIYALIALGYTMVYGVLRLINFAHGEVFMIGAFAAYFAALVAGGGLIVALVAAMCVCGVLGLLMELGVYRPLRSRPRLAALIAAIGLSILLSNLVQALHFDFHSASGETIRFSGASYTPFPADLLASNARYRLLPGREVYVTRIQGLNLGVSVALMAGLWLLVRRTTLGRAMRACANNQEALSLMGVSVNRVIALTFGIGAALAGAAGVLNALTYPRIDATMGLMAGLKAFVAAVLGGIGSVPGAVAGGFIMGLAEVAASGALPSRPVDYTPLADGVAFALLILVLLVRPRGIFGEAESEKV